MDYQRLLAIHDEIDRLCRALVRTVTTERPDGDAILRTRADLSVALDGHRLSAARIVHPAMIARGGAAAAAVMAMADEFAGLTQDWALYLAEWSAECIAADWATFRAETIALVRRLRERARRETAMLYPAALRVGVITLRPAARPVPAAVPVD